MRSHAPGQVSCEISGLTEFAAVRGFNVRIFRRNLSPSTSFSNLEGRAPVSPILSKPFCLKFASESHAHVMSIRIDLHVPAMIFSGEQIAGRDATGGAGNHVMSVV